MKTLHGRLTILVAGLVTLAIAIFGALFYVQMRAQILDTVASETRGTATGFALATGEWMASKVQMVRAVKAAIEQPDAEKSFATAKLIGGFDSVYAGFPDKRSLFSEAQPDLPADWDPTQRPWYQEAERAGESRVVITKPYPDAGTNKLVISISSLVMQGDRLVGVVAADLYIDRIVGEAVGIKPAGAGFGFLLHQDGTILAHPVKEALMKPATDRFPELTPERFAQVKAEGRMFSTRAANGDYFMYLVAIAGTDWLLGVALDKTEAMAPLNRLLWTLLFVLPLLGAVAALIVRYVLGRMLRGLHQVRARMSEIARGGGDLRVRLDVHSDDEVGETARAFNQFLDQLQRMIASLKDEELRLAAGVEQLDRTVGHLASESAAITESSRANAAAVEQVSLAVSRIADTASDTDRLIRATGELSQASAQEVDAVAADAESSVGQVEELARVMAGLDQRSQEINAIVNVIKGIADQTNLLALNAAIEAARAGEQGRGFAVVADEVRKLAENTSQATVEIAQMISAVRDQTGQAGVTVQSAVAGVRRGGDRARGAARQISTIRIKMDDAVTRVGEIAQSTHEQRHATTAMAQNIDQIRQRIETEDRAIQQARDTLATLSQNAQHTRQLLDGFHA